MSEPEPAAQPPAVAPPAAPPAPAPPVPPKADPTKTYVATAWKHASPLISCRFDPKGRFVFTGAQDSTVVRWELASGKGASLAGAHDSWVKAIAFSLDGQTTLTGGYDGRLAWWPTDAEKPEPVRKIDAHAGWVRAVAVSPNGQWIATGGNDQLVKLWNLADGQLIRPFPGHASNVFSVLFHPGGEFLLSGDLEGQVNQWEVASGKLVRSFDAKELHTYDNGQAVHYGGVRSMSLSPDGKHLACAGLHKATNPLGAVQDPLVMVFEWESQKLVQSHLAASDLKGIAWRAVYHPDGFLIGVSGGSGGGILLFWKLDQPNEFHRFALPVTALDLDLHPDGLQLATIHPDNHVRISRMADKPAG